MEQGFLSANVLQCNTAFSVVYVKVCFKSFCLFLLHFFLAGHGSGFKIQ